MFNHFSSEFPKSQKSLTFEIPGANITINMTLLREAEQAIQVSREAQMRQDEAEEVAREMYAESVRLLNQYGTRLAKDAPRPIRPFIFLNNILQSGNPRSARRVLKADLNINDESVPVTITDQNTKRGPRESLTINVLVKGLTEHLELEREGVSRILTGYHFMGWPQYRNMTIDGARKYREVIGMVRAKLEPTAFPAQNPQA